MTITATQLKQTNLILTDYSRLQELNTTYKKQIADYEEMISLYKETERLNDERVYDCLEQIEDDEMQILQLKKSNKGFKIANSVLVGLSAILGLIIAL